MSGLLSELRSGLAVLAVVAGMAGGYASSAYAAVSTPVASGLTAPNGVIWMSGALGGHPWVSDEAMGFCRMDAVAGTATFAINPALCTKVAADPGEAAYDPATNSVYLPDQGGNSQGVWRLKFDPATETVGNPVALAPKQKLGGMSPSAVALGPDGKLYVGLRNKDSVLRITTPSGATQTVESVGRTAAGKRAVRSIAFLGEDLYLADGNALTKIANARVFNGGGKAAAVASMALEPAGLVSDGANLYIGGISSISLLSAAGVQDVYASGFAHIRGLGLDGMGGLYVVQDPADKLPVSQGEMLKVTPGI